MNDHDTPQSRTPALDLEAAEKELDVLTGQAKAAYRAYQDAVDRRAAKAREVRELRRQIRESVTR